MKQQHLLFSLGLLLSAASAQAEISLSSGHADLGLGEGSSLELHLHIHDIGEVEPGEAVIVVPNSTYAFASSNGGRPAGSAWEQIGVGAGESFWYLPQSNSGQGSAAALGAPHLGIGGEEITLGAFDGNSFTLTLTGAVMPEGGNFSLWQDDFTPVFYMSTVDGISAADAFTLDLDNSDHVHANWGFTQAGIYELTFTVSAYVEGIEQSDTATFTFNVVPEPSTYAALAGAATLGFVLLRRRTQREKRSTSTRQG